MIVFRVAKSNYCRDLTGNGARLSGGRWNSKGIPMLYTAENKPLCMFEVLVHIPMHLLPGDFKIAAIEIKKPGQISEIQLNELPPDWNNLPFTSSTQEIGNNFIKQNKNLILKAPSAVIPGSFNLLINPSHSDISTVKVIKVEDFYLDPRIKK